MNNKLIISDKELKLLKDYDIDVYEDEYKYYLETWTNKGIYVFIDIDKYNDMSLALQIHHWINNFDEDEEIKRVIDNDNYSSVFYLGESISLNEAIYDIDKFLTIMKELRTDFIWLYDKEGYYKDDLLKIIYDLNPNYASDLEEMEKRNNMGWYEINISL